MLTFKACKHNMCEIAIAMRKTYLYWCKYHISQNNLKRSKNEKHEFNAIVYAKESQDIYVIL